MAERARAWELPSSRGLALTTSVFTRLATRGDAHLFP
jgi:hypothetical protein